ncbi:PLASMODESMATA CALLOSE-BINDING PROTEIN 3-like [Fagus crenata]
MAAPPQNPVWLLLMTTVITIMMGSNILLGVEGAYWCVARSDASNQALQTALDYACASGADCTPLLSNGLCFLPNTIQAHASYAFNSFFQRKAMAPGSCDFSGTATIAQTDPSFGSCVYPSSVSDLHITIDFTPLDGRPSPDYIQR